MNSNSGSSSPSPMSATFSETFKFSGKWGNLLLFLILMIAFTISAALYQYIRCRVNGSDIKFGADLELGSRKTGTAVDVEANVELAASAPE